MKKSDYVVGIVGGMGSYATVDFFKRLIDAIPGEKEWDRPRIIVDNYCTMPSRVRALLYNERREELVDNLSSSVKNMIGLGVSRIVFACNTSHCFIPDVLQNVPESSDAILHIIDALGKDLMSRNIHNVALVATEGTIDSKIYDTTFEPYDINVTSPTVDEYSKLREFIEAVKQNSIDDAVCHKFCSFIDAFSEDTVILGCTELPILYNACVESGFTTTKKVFDPLQVAIDIIVNEYSSLQ